MHTIDLLEYRDRIIKHLKKVFFQSEQVKEEPKNVYGEFVVEDVSNFIQKINKFEEKFEEKELNDLLQQIKEKLKNIDMSLFRRVLQL